VAVTSDVATSERESRRIEEQVRKNQQALLNLPSQNVLNFQRRVAGVLPVKVDVPKSGKSYRFVRPLVMDEETRVTGFSPVGSTRHTYREPFQRFSQGHVPNELLLKDIPRR
jgi:hypothetical protein